MHLSDLTDLYLDHLRAERGLSEHTLSAYGRDLNKFVTFAESVGAPQLTDVDLALVSDWLIALSKDELGARSTARHLSALRGLMKFLIREGDLSADPAALATGPKAGKRLPRPLSIKQVLALIEQPDTGKPRGLRDRAMLSLAYAAGLRVSELLGLKFGDIDFQRGIIAAFGKGKKRRLVPLGEISQAHLKEYLNAQAGADPTDHSGLVFPSRQGKPLTRQMFWKLVRRCALGAGIHERVHPHRLRHSFATHMLAGGADLRSVQTLLGHADIATTEVYTFVSKGLVRSTHASSHPRA